MTTLVWLQRELRIDQQPVLQAALAHNEAVIVAYFHDSNRQIGEANSVWLKHSLEALKTDIEQKGGALWCLQGDFTQQLHKLLKEHSVKRLYYAYQVGEPFVSQQNEALQICQQLKVTMQPFYSEFLFEPENMLNQQQKPYLVFTPFYKALSKKRYLLEPLAATPADLSLTAKIAVPKQAQQLPAELVDFANRAWAKSMMASWQVGEQASWNQAVQFIKEDLSDYVEQRDFPAIPATSCLSAALHFGEINLRSLYFHLQAEIESQQIQENDAMSWFRQLVWREFARHLLHWFPQLQTEPFQSKYQHMQWQSSEDLIDCWQKGKTGIPIIDAGMNELWQTGVMHNRVRMLVASFLTKNLNQHWLEGQAWFEHTLVDADPANNIMGWQWVAGCGVDAAPYYRLFNPVTQSVKFDAKGEYIKHWLPELSNLSAKAIHSPWEHPMECQMKGIELGKDYPNPLVDLKQSREQHLQRVEQLKAFANTKAG